MSYQLLLEFQREGQQAAPLWVSISRSDRSSALLAALLHCPSGQSAPQLALHWWYCLLLLLHVKKSLNHRATTEEYDDDDGDHGNGDDDDHGDHGDDDHGDDDKYF
ncbi:hypothetical protein WMY93_009389 [Mugilogobius chulae]|uniref:Uncharacterized protein n=1 Tax=Mugilogobius chulae TaxID=88201 RepID=A0AAW0PEM2_9GOBI